MPGRRPSPQEQDLWFNQYWPFPRACVFPRKCSVTANPSAGLLYSYITILNAPCRVVISLGEVEARQLYSTNFARAWHRMFRRVWLETRGPFPVAPSALRQRMESRDACEAHSDSQQTDPWALTCRGRPTAWEAARSRRRWPRWRRRPAARPRTAVPRA